MILKNVKNVGKNIFSGLALFVLTALVGTAAFSSCEVIAQSEGQSLAGETLWLRLTPEAPVLVNGVWTADIWLDFSRPIPDLVNDISPEALNEIITIEVDSSLAGTAKPKALTVVKYAEAIYRITVANIPVNGGFAKVIVNKQGITPSFRTWALDGQALDEGDDSVALTDFRFEQSKNPSLTVINATGDIYRQLAKVMVTVPSGADLGALIPTTSVSDGAECTPQGPNNFSNPVIFTVTSPSAHRDYEVNVIEQNVDSASILVFGFTKDVNPSAGLTQSVFGDINEAAKTITVLVPIGTALTALRPVLTHSGESVTPGVLEANDFSSGATYTVRAKNGSPVVYTVIVRDAPTCSISLLQGAAVLDASVQALGSARLPDYTPPLPFAVKVENTGNLGTGDLTIELLGSGSGAFELSQTSLANIGVGAKSEEWTVSAKAGLSAGSYAASVTVSGASIYPGVSFTIKFKVLAEDAVDDGSDGGDGGDEAPGDIFSFVLKNGSNVLDGGTYSFPNVLQRPYSVPSELTVTVENTGNQPTGALSVTLPQAPFSLPAGSALRTIAAADTRSFTVQPKELLRSGIYSQAFTVSGAHGAKSFTVNFEVLFPHTKSASAPTGGGNSTVFTGLAKDAEGSSYAVGYQNGEGTFSYGQDVSVQVSGNNSHAVIVKYNVSGTALWARTVGGGASGFNGVSVDALGDVYAAGYQTGSGGYTYGSSVSAAGGYSGSNAVIVKYKSGTGAALWAKSVAGSNSSTFNGVATDKSGYTYAVGEQNGNGTFTYGGASAAGGSSYANPVIVRYEGAYGTALWAKSVNSNSSNNPCTFYGVAADGVGNVYTVTTVYKASQTYSQIVYDFGGASVDGGNAGIPSGMHGVIVQYDSGSGTALWAAARPGSGGGSYFYGVAADGAGHVYVVGAWSNSYPIIEKYNSLNGNMLWQKLGSNGLFKGVAADAYGNVYAAGYQNGNTAFDYGGASAQGGSTGANAVIVQYDTSDGAALWAHSVTGSNAATSFNAVATDPLGYVAAAGSQEGTGTFNYADGITKQVSYNGGNAVIVTYR